MAFGKLGQSLTALEIFDLVRGDLEQVEREIGLESISSVDAVTYINQYLQAGGGKRLRPILVLLSGHLVGEANSTLTRMAAVVEMIHTATLVHDDVIDIAKTRRGRPSINVVWGNHLRPRGRLAVHAGVPDRSPRTQLPHPRCAHQPDADDGGRRTAPARADRQDRHHRSRLHGAGRPEDREPVRGLRQAGRPQHRSRRNGRDEAGRIRLEPWHRLPIDRRYPGFHIPRKDTGKARGERSSRGKSYAASDLRA